MPIWAWTLIAVIAGLAILASAGYLGWGAWRRYEQQTVLRLIRRREALRAARQSFSETLAYLAAADNEMLERFASDPDEIHRRVLHDVAFNAAGIRDELDVMALPAATIPAAESLADAAWFLAEQAGRIDGTADYETVLAALGEMDLDPLAHAFADADADVDRVCSACEVEDTAVYGGGLYV